MDKNKASSKGIGFCSLLCIVFIALKLTDNIDWSWWWVLAPLWIPWCVVLAVLGIVIGGGFVFYFLQEKLFNKG